MRYGYADMFQWFSEYFSTGSITENDIPSFQSVFNKNKVVLLLQDILQSPEILERIAARSYTHALRFDKIILADASKDIPGNTTKNQVRLHIWEPEANALPMVESLHEHSFDFVSTVLTGKLENQRFEMGELKDKTLLDKVLAFEDKAWLNAQIEYMEAYKLKFMGSHQFDDLAMQEKMDIKALQERLGVNYEEALSLTTLEGHYVSDRVAGEKKAYRHVLEKYVSLRAKDVLHIDAGRYYYHPYILAHRLYYDSKVLNSTILITTHVSENPEGGSLQRPSYVQGSEQHYDKLSFTVERMRQKLQDYIQFLERS